MPKTTNADDFDPISPFFAGGNRSPSDLKRSTPSARQPLPATARSRISAVSSKKAKRGRALPMGPTPERLAKGDISPITAGGFRRSISTVEKLRDGGKLDHDARTNEAMFQAAEKLRRHFEGSLIGVKAQDLNRIIGGGGDELTGEEAWVHNFDTFTKACKLMGWSQANPHRGAGRITVAVVCFEMTVTEAAGIHVADKRKETALAAGMDRLREGLYALSIMWRT
ncbi:hypothetical protein [Beijerinckia sp. L45]|uniref:hypothetical protein n=1 Tax=Beijerinckia sp. L45 TaxID=1641855 RepID=UPI00131E488D|nr:hypothetical protein [Beijerinckia sp. L45]